MFIKDPCQVIEVTLMFNHATFRIAWKARDVMIYGVVDGCICFPVSNSD